jgi:twitching motility two-component system response regulator PilH
MGGSGTILVVDDSPTELLLFGNALRKAGYRVETASNGEEGVRMARRLHPDLILMDVVMPVLNGFQATRQLQRDAATAGIPVIMVTTKDQETDRTWGLRQGALDYLVKPVDTEALVERIRVALRG